MPKIYLTRCGGVSKQKRDKMAKIQYFLRGIRKIE